MTKEERIFLAGCVKSMMLSDGTIENQEIIELDALVADLAFSDFDDCLEEFETLTKDEESFWEMAASIKRATARDVILESLRLLMLNAGAPGTTGENIIHRLEEIWRSEHAQ